MYQKLIEATSIADRSQLFRVCNNIRYFAQACIRNNGGIAPSDWAKMKQDALGDAEYHRFFDQNFETDGLGGDRFPHRSGPGARSNPQRQNPIQTT